MKHAIFHVPNYIDKNRKSGSHIRPQRMLRAFVDNGYEVDMVMGYGAQRKAMIDLIEANLESGVVYDFCYSESSTMPTLLTEANHLPTYPCLDFGFFKTLKASGVPIGLFYRDIHWAFPFYNKLVSKGKQVVTRFFYRYDLKQYNKYVDLLYLPSVEMRKHVPIIDGIAYKALPPGVEERAIRQHIPHDGECLQLFYVGGLGDLYNVKSLIETVATMENVRLTICTRPEEWKQMKGEYEPLFGNHTQVVHLSGEDLEEAMVRADVAVLYLEPSSYWEFVVPVKLFSYLEANCPVIVTKELGVSNFIESRGVGWSIPYDNAKLRETLLWLQKNPSEIAQKRQRIDAIIQEETWKARAAQVAGELSRLRRD